ncbi:YihY/virulence factor BrkB family protein [Bacteriovorax sp. Seq25_V]|uniref:YihY/virulence factor BrkB family protein n=1 Tax=Bacteriovorax sp. Seq25_V TaxID=1201288 RepID=UPI0005555576|nr:YhjD/YihY/BrkB family envelope integrity protein [Bacteriovorax sp. Seq25_V]
MKILKKMKGESEFFEQYFFNFVKEFITRFLSAIFLFKKRKGEVLAGATTFFTILSFGPAILLIISVIGLYVGDNEIAKEHVITTLFSSFPKIDPSILKSLRMLIEEQISGHSVKLYQVGIWFFACLGISTSFVFGINTLSKVDVDGGFFQDDVKSFIFGVLMALFFLVVFMLFEKQFILTLVETFLTDSDTILKIIEIVVWPFAILFFGLFYKFSAQIEVSLKDALWGGCVFTLLFFLGKSSYWLYLKYFKDDLYRDYGNFYNFMVAMLWVYFIVCSFYIGASFTYVNKVKVFVKAKKK